MDELLKWRDEFPILRHTTYLISNSLGAMPRAVSARLQDYADAWATRGVRAWEEGWWEMAVDTGGKIGALVGAGPGEISLHQNVTLTQAVISSCFNFSPPRNKVVLVDLEFPSIIYFYLGQQRHGARVEILPSADGIHAPMERLLAAIDETTLLVPISLVLFRSSSIVDAEAIIERAHSVGAHVILDCFQAAGTMPIDLHALHVDFAVGGVLRIFRRPPLSPVGEKRREMPGLIRAERPIARVGPIAIDLVGAREKVHADRVEQRACRECLREARIRGASQYVGCGGHDGCGGSRHVHAKVGHERADRPVQESAQRRAAVRHHRSALRRPSDAWGWRRLDEGGVRCPWPAVR